jgi:hypothetical protein
MSWHAGYNHTVTDAMLAGSSKRWYKYYDDIQALNPEIVASIKIINIDPDIGHLYESVDVKHGYKLDFDNGAYITNPSPDKVKLNDIKITIFINAKIDNPELLIALFERYLFEKYSALNAVLILNNDPVEGENVCTGTITLYKQTLFRINSMVSREEATTD